MQRIYDNNTASLRDGIREKLRCSFSADFCSGYFTLDGFDLVSDLIYEKFLGDSGSFCRILVGRDTGSQHSLSAQHLVTRFLEKLRLCGSSKKKNELERFKHLIKCKKIFIKFSTSDSIHAKLYLFHGAGARLPSVAIVGSGNLTYNGLVRGRELNIDITEKETCLALQNWFEHQWQQEDCIDISDSISWSDYRKIEEGDLYLLASICDEEDIGYFVDKAGTRFEVPAGFLCDRKGIEEGLNPEFEESIRQISEEVGLEDIYFPTNNLYSNRSAYDGMSLLECFIENFVDTTDPNYLSTETLERIRRAVDKDNT